MRGLILFLPALTASVFSAERVPVHKTLNKPTIDGKSTENCWSQTTPLSPFREALHWSLPTPVRSNATDCISFCWDGSAFYILASTPSSSRRSLQPESSVFRLTLPQCIIELGTDGWLLLRYPDYVTNLDTVSVSTRENLTTIEASIPFHLLPIEPAVGRLIKLSVERLYADRLLVYSDTLELVLESEKTPALRLISLYDPEAGGLRTELTNPSDQKAEVELKLRLPLDRLIFSQTVSIKPGGSSLVTIPYPLKDGALVVLSAFYNKRLIYRSPPFACLLAQCPANPSPLSLLPEPAEVRIMNGTFKGRTSVFWKSEEVELPRVLPPGFRFSRKPSAPVHLLTTRSKALPAPLHDLKSHPSQSYSMLITPEKVYVVADDPTGFFYGLQSLSQLKNPPALRISDRPTVPLRGLLLGEPPTESLLFAMSRYKLNTLVVPTANPELSRRASTLSILPIRYLHLYGLGLLLPRPDREKNDPLIPCPSSPDIRRELQRIFEQVPTPILLDCWLPPHPPDRSCKAKGDFYTMLLRQILEASDTSHLLFLSVDPSILDRLPLELLKDRVFLVESPGPYPLRYLAWLSLRKGFKVGAVLRAESPFPVGILDDLNEAVATIRSGKPGAIFIRLDAIPSTHFARLLPPLFSSTWRPLPPETTLARLPLPKDFLSALRVCQSRGVLIPSSGLLRVSASSLPFAPPHRQKSALELLKTVLTLERLASEALKQRVPPYLKSLLQPYVSQSKELFFLKKSMEAFVRARKLYEEQNETFVTALKDLRRILRQHLEVKHTCPFASILSARIGADSFPLDLCLFGVYIADQPEDTLSRLKALAPPYTLLRRGEIYQFALAENQKALRGYAEAFRTQKLSQYQITFLHRALSSMPAPRFRLKSGVREGLPSLFYLGEYLLWFPGAERVSLRISLLPRPSILATSKPPSNGILWLPVPGQYLTVPSGKPIRPPQPTRLLKSEWEGRP